MAGCRHYLFALGILFGAALSILALTPAYAQQANIPVATPLTLIASQELPVEKGGRLSSGSRDVLVERHGICRWLDNEHASNNYFVPTGSLADWQAFINNTPGSVIAAACCPARNDIVLRSSDGQEQTMSVDIGRVGATNTLGMQNLEATFTVTRPADGATWTETVREIYICQAGAWTGQGQAVTGGPGPDWYTSAWGACSETCGGGIQSRAVECRDENGVPVDESECGGIKPDATQACNTDACITGGSCVTEITSIVNTDGTGGCSSSFLDRYRGRACDPAVFSPDTQDFAMCTATIECVCPPAPTCTLGDEVAFISFYVSSPEGCLNGIGWPQSMQRYRDIPECTGDTNSNSYRACRTRMIVRDTRPMGNMGPMPFYCTVRGHSCSDMGPGSGGDDDPILLAY